MKSNLRLISKKSMLESLIYDAKVQSADVWMFQTIPCDCKSEKNIKILSKTFKFK